jgi:hypothetical protein
MDELRLVETVDRLGESIVITVANAANRRLDARLRQSLGILDRDVLAASIAVVHEPTAMGRAPIMEGLLQRIQYEATRTWTGRRSSSGPNARLSHRSLTPYNFGGNREGAFRRN